MSDLTHWTYKRSHSITSGTTLTDYQVKIRVYRSEGTSTGDTVYLGSKCLADYGDIRFVASDDTTELSYWMETNAGTYADFWVKVPSIVSDSYIYIYYGNSSATTTSNGDTTFQFFDDFTGTSLNTSKWGSTPISYNGGTGTISVNNALTLTQTNGANRGVSLRSANALSSDTLTIRTKVNARSAGTSEAQIRLVLNNSSNADAGVFGLYTPNTGTSYLYNGFGVGNPTFADTFTISSPTIYEWEGRVANPRAYKDGVLKCTGSGTPTAPAGNYIRIWTYSTTASITLDWICVRSYAATEPTHVSWSEEQEVTSYPLRITITPTSGTDPLSVSYNLSSSDALDDFVLNFGDGQEYTGDDITTFATTHTYNTPGTYTVWAEGYNEFATHVYYEIPYGVTVSAPSVVASFTTSQSYNTITFTNTSTGNINECYWDFGDGNHSYEQNPVHIYHTSGTYTVTLHTSNQYQYDDDDQEMVVSEVLVIPDAYFKPSRHISIYPVFPLSISFTNLSNTDVGCTYLWDFGNDTTSTDENPTAIYDELGTYDVSLTITNPLGTSIRSYIDAVYLLECPFIIAKEQVVVSDTMHGFAFTLIHEVIEVVDQIIRSAICRETVKVYNGDDFMVQGHDEYGIGHTRSRHNEYGIHIIRKKFSQFGAKITQAIRNRTNTDCVGIEQIAVCRETVYVNVSTQDDESP